MSMCSLNNSTRSPSFSRKLEAEPIVDDLVHRQIALFFGA